jgi:hypothetical protein
VVVPRQCLHQGSVLSFREAVYFMRKASTHWLKFDDAQIFVSFLHSELCFHITLCGAAYMVEAHVWSR